MASWKREFASGLIVVGPILVTLYVIYRLYAIVTGLTPVSVVDETALRGVIDHGPTRVLVARVLHMAVSLSFFAVVTITVGSLTRTTIGDLFSDGIDGIANRLPGLRVVYNASKVAAETTLGEEQALQEPVKVTSWDNKQMTAFKTGHLTPDGKEVLFIPTAPNVTSGFVVEADPERVTETDEPIEEALARVLSGGFGDTDTGPGTTVPFNTSETRSADDE
ncbi:DUF502 domain-containing protein [Natrinema sp. 74]|uniref:DUF502 domain-containing protein n=1 Tax=Natrinema sp. 74 TaxID=3384159 RepID=UPI0038D3888F